MKATRRTLMAALLAAAGLATGLGATPALAEDTSLSFMAPVKQTEGVIQQLDFGANTMIFEGTRYHMGPDLEVTIRGSYGAFTMLTPGMKAVITYRVVSGSHREVMSIEQLPDNASIEGA